MKPRLLLVSHGLMAEETIHSAEMIVGSMENTYAVSMLADDGAAGLRKKLDDLLSTLDPCSTIIMADLYGGTPCNVASQLAMESNQFTLVAGLNLAMVIEYAVSATEDPAILAGELVEASKSGILKVELSAIDADDDEEIEIE